jgi:hypothetical protein
LVRRWRRRERGIRRGLRENRRREGEESEKNDQPLPSFYRGQRGWRGTRGGRREERREEMERDRRRKKGGKKRREGEGQEEEGGRTGKIYLPLFRASTLGHINNSLLHEAFKKFGNFFGPRFLFRDFLCLVEDVHRSSGIE